MRIAPLLVALMFVPVGGAVGWTGTPPGHLRCAAKHCAEFVADAIARSPVVAGLVAELEETDVIVYVELLMSPQTESIKGSLRFVAFTGGTRFLLVQVDGNQMLAAERAALLGHELYHAVELARAPGVRDQASFRALYAHIGTEGSTGHFETESARAAERQVRAEIAGFRPHHGVEPPLDEEVA